jgi:putative two-component system response regulator
MNESRKKKILIVDDDPGDILLLRKILEPDYLVIAASDCREAMAVVNVQCPDLVLLDVMMPRHSGYTLCVLMKCNPSMKDIPVVMVTGLNTEMNKMIGKNMGADDYLVKPIQVNKLRNIILELLMGKHQPMEC